MAQTDTTNRVGGTVFVKVDGKQLRVRGKWTLGQGQPKREAVVGLDGVHGFKETPQAPYIAGEISPGQDLDLKALQGVRNATVTCEYGQGKVGALRNAWFAGEGEIDLEEGSAAVRFEGLSFEQVS